MLTSVQNPKTWKWGTLIVWVPIWTRRPENQGANGVVSRFDPKGPRTWRADVQGRRRWITWFKHKANLSFPLSFYFIQILNWLDDAHMRCHVIRSVMSDSVTTWTIAHQALESMGFSRQKKEWVAISSSRGSSWPRDWTQVSSIAGKFFTIWATRDSHMHW